MVMMPTAFFAKPKTHKPPRKRKHFAEDKILVLRFAKENPGIVAHVLGEVAVVDIVSDMTPVIVPFPSAINDLDSPPLGAMHPARVVKESTGYRRNDTVRQYVLARANGRCEHCGELGFEMSDGTRYLEAHHIIALANDGPDTVKTLSPFVPCTTAKRAMGVMLKRWKFYF